MARPARNRDPHSVDAPTYGLDPLATATLVDGRDRGDGMFVPPLLALDRRSDRGVVSVAGTGLLTAAAAVSTRRDDLDNCVFEALASLRLLRRANPAGNLGWFSHFTDPLGNPLPFSEVSTIDTALLLAGYRMLADLAAGQIDHALHDELVAAVDDAIAAVDLGLVVRDGRISHGFTWDGEHGEGTPQPIPHLWDDTAEGVLVYWLFGERLLAEGHRGDWWQPAIERSDYPLFVYVYPLCFEWATMPRDVAAQRTRWRDLLVDCLHEQQRRYGYVGQTATDGPDGYSVDSPTLVAPILLSALALDESLPHVRATLRALIARGVSPMAMNYDFDRDWTSGDTISIDLGSAILAEHIIRTRGRLM